MIWTKPFKKIPFICLLIHSALLLSPQQASALDEDQGFQAEIRKDALIQTQLKLELQPENKIIERIVIASRDSITPDEPWPILLNKLHQVTHPEVIHRELLFNAGDPWIQKLALESERNLRNYLFLSVANIIPCQGSQPDRIIVLVLTKDLWSLRLNTDFSYVGSSFDFLELQIEEANLLGNNKNIKGIFHSTPFTLSLAEEYSDPRVFGNRISATEKIGMIQNKTTGATEGGIAQVSIGKPLYRLSSEWAWNISASTQKDIFRLISGGQIQHFISQSTHQSVPITYDRRSTHAQASITRSFGDQIKQNLTAGWRAKIAENTLSTSHQGIDPLALEEFKTTYLPFSESYAALYLRYQLFFNEFSRLTNFQTFALTEDIQLGPNFSIETTIAQPAFGWSSSFFAPSARASYSLLSGDHLLMSQISASARYQPGVFEGKTWLDPSVSIGLRDVSPRFGIFRVHTGLRLLRKNNDLSQALETLGGDSYLRGYPSHAFSGTQSWSGNLELRTLPFSFQTAHLGAVAFLDLGDTFNSLEQISTHASIGLGIRALFPQFNRQVIRVDLGVPLEKLTHQNPSYIIVQFGQTF